MVRTICRLAVLCVTILSAPVLVVAQGNCDASIIEAMKSNFKNIDSDNVSLAVKKAACEDSSDMTSISAYYVGYTRDQIKKACNSDDTTFFRQHYKDLSFSILPDQAFETLRVACGSSLIRLRAAESGSAITVTASYTQAGNDNPTKVESFRWSQNIQQCRGIYPGMSLGNGDRTADCVRKKGDGGLGDANFYISTKKGDQAVRLLAKHSYELWVFYSDDYLTCKVDDTVVVDKFHGFGSYDMPPLVKQSLNDTLQTPGRHILSCVGTEVQGFQGHPCWKFKFQLKKDGSTIYQVDTGDTGCQSDSDKQPPPFAPKEIVVK